MTKLNHEIDCSILIWYCHQKGAGLSIQVLELRDAMRKFACLSDDTDFKALEG